MSFGGLTAEADFTFRMCHFVLYNQHDLPVMSLILTSTADRTDISSGSRMQENPVDPKKIVRVDSLILERTSHYLQLAPFLVVVNEDKSSKLESCQRNNIDEWNPRNALVCGMFGTCPSSHTIGLFTANYDLSSNVKEIIIYIIDGKDHENDDNYLEYIHAAVEVFKTNVMHFPSSRPHCTRDIGFSLMRGNDRINSSLHMRQCFRELAGLLSLSPVRITSAKILSNLIDDSFSSTSTAHAFHRDAFFEGVRVQIARRCWTKDLEDAICFLIDEKGGYAGSYGSEGDKLALTRSPLTRLPSYLPLPLPLLSSPCPSDQATC